MKRALALAVLIALRLSATQVSAIVTSSENAPYANGTYRATLVDANGNPLYLAPGASTYSGARVFTGSLDSTGMFSLVLTDNASILAGSQWKFTVCAAKPTSVCFTVPQTISGSTQSLSSALSALAPSIAISSSPLILPADPVTALQAATKQYVDAHSGGGTATGAPATPSQASSAGYNALTYYTSMLKADVDIGQTYASGFKWYFGNFFSQSPASSATVSYSLGYATLGANNAFTQISSIGRLPAAGAYVGTAFGSGYYAEASIAYSPTQVQSAGGRAAGAWPSFFTDSLEHFQQASPVTSQWPGQATNYETFVEVDILEADLFNYGSGIGNASTYGATVHNFWGISNSTCPPNYCQASTAYGGGSNYSNNAIPTGTDLSQFHRYGALWIPATSGTSGSITFYFDGQPTGASVSWTQFTNQSPPPGTSAWTFGAIDQQHQILILETGPNEQMQVQYVAVWQANSANNLVH